MIYDALRPLLFRFDAEIAHQLALGALAAGLAPRTRMDFPRLHRRILGIDFPNPIGLAAGFD